MFAEIIVMPAMTHEESMRADTQAAIKALTVVVEFPSVYALTSRRALIVGP
jgi:hypothetical protein